MEELKTNLKILEVALNDFKRNKKLTTGDELALQHINAKVKQLYKSFIERLEQ
jgi:ASC-1-like (ASCH) protein